MIVVLIITTLTSCGGGGGSSGPKIATSPPTPVVLNGTFLDSPVSGLGYRTPTQSGLTNNEGQFSYIVGEQITFSLGGIELGRTSGSGIVTPLDLVNVASVDQARELHLDNQLINILVFLQSLDTDRNPENGISLADLNQVFEHESLNFNQNHADFRSGSFKRLVNLHGGFYQSPKAALNHLLKSLSMSISVELIIQDRVDIFGDGTIDLITDFTYDQNGQLINLSSSSNQTDLISETVFEYDLDGNMIRRDAGNIIDTFTYHPLFGFLSRETKLGGSIRYTLINEYDSIGNLIRREQSQIGLQNGVIVFDPFFTLFPNHTTTFSIPTPRIPLEFGERTVPSFFGPKPIPTAVRNILPSDRNILDQSVVTVNDYNSDGLLIDTRTTTSSNLVDPPQITDSNLSYEDSRLTSITLQTSHNAAQQLDFVYDQNDHLTDCKLTSDEINFVSTPFSLLRTSAELPALTVCPFSLQYENDKISRLTTGSLPSTHEYSYERDLLSDVRVDADGNGHFDFTSASSYTLSGSVLEQEVKSDGRLIFKSVKSYMTLILTKIP